MGLIWDAPGLPSQSVPLPSHFFTTRKVSVLLSNSQIFLQNVVFSAVTRICLRLFTVCYFQFDSSQHHLNRPSTYVGGRLLLKCGSFVARFSIVLSIFPFLRFFANFGLPTSNPKPMLYVLNISRITGLLSLIVPNRLEAASCY